MINIKKESKKFNLIKTIHPNRFNFTKLTAICLTGILFIVIQFSYIYLLLFIFCLVSSLLITKQGIKILKEKEITQFIRKEGPKSHRSKEGTPTIGGMIIIPFSIILMLLVCINADDFDKILNIILLLTCFLGIGFLDDYIGSKAHRNRGLSVKNKFLLQFIASIIFLTICINQDWINQSIYLYGNHEIYLGKFILPIYCLIITGLSNASNLSDGLDGLASGCSVLIFIGLAINLVLQNNGSYSSFIIICLIMAGTWFGFLILNKNPAQIFMGDSGSLSIGAVLAGIGILTNSIFPVLIMSGIFLLEALSVILQVSFFKITKKFKKKGERIFLMAPIHHHYELKGLKESEIVYTFWWITFCLTFIGILLRSRI
tara:strand:- start:11288 stop:12406 length:1119 start_codon:yes stop_codon:yes gene_type:complete